MKPLTKFDPDEQADQIARSVVALVALGESGATLGFYTGFLCRLAGQVFWCTAAHVFDKTAELCEQVSVSRWGLVGCHGGRESFVDFNYSQAPRVSIPDICEDLLLTRESSDPQYENAVKFKEMDFGCVLLSSRLYTEGLFSTGVQPLSEVNLLQPAEVKPEHQSRRLQFFVFGLPQSDWSIDNPSCLTLKWLPVELHEEGPLIHKFSPAWSQDLHSGHVRGMSGGPVVAFMLNEPIVIGIQMSQFGTDKHVSYLRVADSLYAFEFLKSAIESVKFDLDANDIDQEQRRRPVNGG